MAGGSWLSCPRLVGEPDCPCPGVGARWAAVSAEMACRRSLRGWRAVAPGGRGRHSVPAMALGGRSRRSLPAVAGGHRRGSLSSAGHPPAARFEPTPCLAPPRRPPAFPRLPSATPTGTRDGFGPRLAGQRHPTARRGQEPARTGTCQTPPRGASPARREVWAKFARARRRARPSPPGRQVSAPARKSAPRPASQRPGRRQADLAACARSPHRAVAARGLPRPPDPHPSAPGPRRTHVRSLVPPLRTTLRSNGPRGKVARCRIGR
jgi:hypothetical protein